VAVKLAYIVSAGHSGSTLLDLVTGSIPGGFSAGEFNYFPWQISRRESAGSGASPQKLCSCGQGFHQCMVWRQVVLAASKKVGFDIFTDPFRFRMNLLQNEKFHGKRFSLDRLNRAIYSFANQHDLLCPVTSIYSDILTGSVQNNWLMFDTISETLHKNFVVDSSKSPLRLRMLFEGRPENTYAIVLFRDIRGVAYSGQKLGENPLSVAVGWVRQYNQIWNIVRRMIGVKLLCVRYESLVEDPQKERRRIAAFLGSEDVPNDLRIDTTTYHLTAGNAVRYGGILDIRADVAWETGLNASVIGQIEKIRSRLTSAWGPYLEEAGG